MPTRSELAAQIVRASRALHARGWVANHDGNVKALLEQKLSRNGLANASVANYNDKAPAGL